jgi:glycosyltransferase involved in cell wall biosynthesis
VITAVICTYNPKRELLRRVLNALQQQSLSASHWEIVLVDNASKPPVTAGELDYKLTNLRIVCESQPGLTYARLCGFAEAIGELVIFVDDDNVLASNYMEQALALAKEHPAIGVFSANIVGEFSVPVLPWMQPYLRYLAINEMKSDCWSLVRPCPTLPIGAGMVVRRVVMKAYAVALRDNPHRVALDRKGGSLFAGGDTDIGYSSLSLELGCGRFRALNLTHVIPAARLDIGYLLNLVRDISASHMLLKLIHGDIESSDIGRFRARSRRVAQRVLGILYGRKSPQRLRAGIAQGVSLAIKLWNENERLQ